MKKKGFFLSTFDSLKTNRKEKIAYFKLNNKTDSIFINYKPTINPITFTNKKTPIEELPNELNRTTNKLEALGYLFSEVSIQNIHQENNLLYADVKITKNSQRKIDKIIIKGYEQFSKKKLYHFLNLKKNKLINSSKLKEISRDTDKLDFISELKKPEILFKKDSTLLYIHLKKEKKNTFNGIINFASKEDEKGILFTGHLKLNLNNILNYGEKINLSWLANGEERQSFSLSTKLPYILNSPITLETNFKLHKQDSTFLSNSLNISLNHNTNTNSSINLNYDSENSQNTLISKQDETYLDFKNNFIGLGFDFNHKLKNKIKTYLKISFGKRNSENNTENQFKFLSSISYLYQMNKKNSVFIKNKTELLFSETELTNELYRIGGTENIRGFDQESIFTSKYSCLNLEYHHHTSIKSYLYSITDFALIYNDKKIEKNWGLGLGYSFTSKSNQIKLESVISKKEDDSFNLNNSKIYITLTSFF